MTNLQQLLTELETKQHELEAKLKKAKDLEVILQQKHEQNLINLQKQVEKDITVETLDKNLINQDDLKLDISKLRIEISDIENSLNEVFKL